MKPWESVRRRVYKRDANKCQICLNSDKPSLHHILPLSFCLDSKELKYFNSEFNLVLLCEDCHIKLHHKKIVCAKYTRNRDYLPELMQLESERRKCQKPSVENSGVQ